jgi:hypothetical protein
MTMSDTAVWYGYLEAGDKSTPVLRDRRLSTGNPKTIYLYNLKRSAIVAYSREIVEPKLRELKEEERGVTHELARGYAETRKAFQPHGTKMASRPEKGGAASPRRQEEDEEIHRFDDKIEKGIEDVDWGNEAE